MKNSILDKIISLQELQKKDIKLIETQIKRENIFYFYEKLLIMYNIPNYNFSFLEISCHQSFDNIKVS